MFDQNILWSFEDLKMLLGTDLPIFGGDTYPCISLQLRNMSKPIRVLSGIDYWLDNLMSHVPKVTMHYQSNSFVQKHELVVNKDLPSLNDSSCASEVITCVAQNLLSFLKLNTIIPGHTYWLFKGKNDDIVKLYDLSSLYPESWFEDFNEGQNPFTVSVAMLLYNVAWNLKNNPIDDIPSNLANIEILLNNCLKLLNTTKYPQVVTAVCYMLSDFYIPFDMDYFASPKIEDFNNTVVNSLTSCVDSDKNLSINSDTEESISLIGKRDLCLSHKKTEKSQKLKNPTSEIMVMTLEERCRKTLYHIGVGLNCFQYFKDLNDKCRKKNNVSQINDESNTAALSVTLPCSTSTTKKSRKMKREKKVVKKGIKKKNQKHIEGSVAVENDADFISILFLVKYVTYIMPKWGNLPQSQDNFIKEHMIILFYEKACRTYVLLAENERVCTKYGTALKYYRSFYKCWANISNFILTDYNGFLLERSGDCCMLIAKNWDKVKQYKIELETDDECDLKIMKSLLGKFDSCKQEDFNLIPTKIESKETTLNAAVNCYKRGLEVETNEDSKKNLNGKLGNVYREMAARCIDELSNASTKKIKISSSRLQSLLKTCENYLTIGINKFESICDLKSAAVVYFNKGELYQILALHSSQNKLSNSDLMKEKDFIKMAAECFTKSLAVMGNRRSNEYVWDLIFFNLSTMIYKIATQYQDNPPKHLACDQIDTEKEVINLLLKALKHCDLDNDVSRKLMYEARAGNIHNRLATLYHSRLRRIKVNTPKFKTTLRQCSSHYNDAYEIFLKMNNPLQCLEVLLKNIALDQLQFEKTTCSKLKVKFIMSITQKLSENCVRILQMILESKLDEYKEDHSTDNDNLCKPDQNTKNNLDTETKKLLLLTLKDRLQHILMCMIKLSITKLPRFVDKAEQLKSIYGDFLRTTEADDNCSILLKVIIQIKELNL